MINVILPCPKCKGAPMICALEHEFWVACKDCCYDTVSYDFMEDAVLDWNRRVKE